MELTDVIAQMGGLKSMASELGVSESQAASGAAALLPAILGGFKKQAQARAEAPDGLGALLGQLGGGELLDDVLAPAPTNVNRGNDVLGTIFGSKDVSRAVAQHASGSSGVDTTTLKRMLPILAMVVTGLMAKQRSSSSQQSAAGAGGLGGLGGLLGGLLGGGARSGSSTGGLGGLASMLDADGDGNPLDDILGMMGR
ncbi:MAG: DUF937 domain-containing protein [Gemmatimonadales bacterium]